MRGKYWMWEICLEPQQIEQKAYKLLLLKDDTIGSWIRAFECG